MCWLGGIGRRILGVGSWKGRVVGNLNGDCSRLSAC